MQEYISVNVITLKELFSGAYDFRLPFFQRAYAWQTAEVGRLLENVVEAMNAAAGPKRYFLGRLMLAQMPGNPDTALVDGHQRIMSLTILFAVLRDLETDEDQKKRLHGFIAGPGYRLNPQETLADFCGRYVQARGATEIEPDDDLEELGETERNIIENRNHLRAELGTKDFSAQSRRQLADFLADNCCVITSSVHDEDEAWRILRIEEETRVEFNQTDRAKATLLSIVAAEDRIPCQRAWERCEADLGFSDMHALLGHIRTMRLRKRSEKPIEIDLAEGFKLNMAGAGRAFLDNELAPAALRLAAIRRLEVGTGEKHKASVARSIDRLTWIHHQLWVPAALLWLLRRGDDAGTALFFARLERLIWIMRLAGLDPTKQQVRILQLLGEIERVANIDDMRELEIGKTLRETALSNLRSKTFDSKHYAAKVLRRISDAIGQDPGPIHPEKVTIEHILPRAWPLNDNWKKRFPSKKSVQTYAHKLGNLTFLTGAENHAADTLDWSAKRPILAGSRLLLANRLAATVDWTPESIMSRTEDMIRILLDAWDLKL